VPVDLFSVRPKKTKYGGSTKMTKFEYKCVFIWGGSEKTTRILNDYGKDGWELVCTYWCWHYFKRPIE
jgi:hypothetical protein